MSFLRFTKVAKPSNPAASTLRTYYDTAGPGYNTPAALCAIDESGNQAMLGHLAVLDYRILKVSVFTNAGANTWTPANGCRAAYAELVGGGGAGGGAATSSSQVSVGGGGGGGAYAASWITGVNATVSLSVGAAGTAGGAGASGGNGGDSTWASTVIVAKGGTGGAAMAAGTTLAAQVGGAGGAAASCTGDLKVSGGQGEKGIRLSTTQGWSGDGGAAAFLGCVGANGVVAVSAGAAGLGATATCYGSGGSGGATILTASAGGAGAAGLIRVWEFA